MRYLWTAAGLLLFCLVPPVRADEPVKDTKAEPKKEGKAYEIPYQLTNTKHVMVRVKINGKGPFNFIIDTGAPALYVGTAVCEKLKIKPDKDGWGIFDKFEIEGGLAISKARGRVEDPFQLKGMNKLGLAGMELHGIIGYSVLAKFKMEFDFTSTKLVWTELPTFEPKAPERLGGAATGGVDTMAFLVDVIATLLGNRPAPEVGARGFLGIELEEDKDGLLVKSLIDKGPAAAAGIKVGDRITHYSAWEVPTLVELQKRLAKRVAGDEVTLKIVRSGAKKDITLKIGEGL
jgi:serine protease DegQ